MQILIFVLLGAIMAERATLLAVADEAGWVVTEGEQSEKGMESEKEKDEFKDKVADLPAFRFSLQTLIRELYFHSTACRPHAYIPMPELPPELL